MADAVASSSGVDPALVAASGIAFAARRRPCQLLGAMLLLRLLDIYSLILFVSVILSWTGLAYDHPVMRVARALTEPLLAPIRRVLPTVGGIDFSPMLLIVLINVLRRMLAR